MTRHVEAVRKYEAPNSRAEYAANLVKYSSMLTPEQAEIIRLK